MGERELSVLITDLKGVGDKTGKLFNKCGVFTCKDLLTYYPRDYDRFGSVLNAADAVDGSICAFKLTIIGNVTKRRVRNLSIISFEAGDQTGKIKMTYFNAPYLYNSIKPGHAHIFRGMIRKKGNFFTMDQPKMYTPEEYALLSGSLQPKYSLVKGLSNNAVIKAVTNTFKDIGSFEEYIPKDILDRLGLISYSDAVYNIHFPKNIDMLEKARRRLAYDEFLLFILKLRLLKLSQEDILNSYPMIEVADVKLLLEKLPYKLTAAQMKVWNEISQDLSGKHVMNRLIQGDVGSGKTIISFMALLTAAANGYQGAIMAPTEVLATQHFENFKNLIDKYSITSLRPVLLTGSLSAKDKKAARELIASGEANCIVGTNALIQEKVDYKNLALVVTDEQHRFGVRQRETFAGKGENVHVLAMSATPIPRTLAIILYGDLSISVIDELPKGRLPIKNCVVGTDYRDTAYKFIKTQVENGHQAYVICPMIEEGELNGAENVIDYTEKLRNVLPPGIRVQFLHGKMKPQVKDEIMEAFANRDIDVLVSTTVIEVGIDVPNATVIMIENSERFGLSQLHQLRGRVGRGDAQSYCIFINTSNSEDTAKRLDIMNKSNDGFVIAQKDLEQRGPGDLFGVRQSGELSFRVGDIYHDSDLVKEAAMDADRILASDEDLSLPQHTVLKKMISTKSANFVDFTTL